jgi:hypothetical protein
MTSESIKCPYPDCGYIYQKDLNDKVKEGLINFTRGFLCRKPKGEIQKKQEKIDLKCPLCKREFKWPV